AQVGRVDDLGRELLHHRALRALPGEADQPAQRERRAPLRVDLDRNLVVRAAHAPALDLERRLHVVDRLLEELERVVLGLLLHDAERVVHDSLRGGALAPVHHGVDELGHERAVVQRVRRNLTARNQSPTRHTLLSSRPSSSLKTTTDGASRLTPLPSPAGVRLRPNDRPASRILAVLPVGGPISPTVSFRRSRRNVSCSTPPPGVSPRERPRRYEPKPWGASLRTCCGPACGPARPPHRGFPARCGSARPAGPSRVRRASALSSAPGGCDPRRGCTPSPRCGS